MNRWVFRARRNECRADAVNPAFIPSSPVDAAVTVDGRLFHILVAATRNARSPSDDLTRWYDERMVVYSRGISSSCGGTSVSKIQILRAVQFSNIFSLSFPSFLSPSLQPLPAARLPALRLEFQVKTPGSFQQALRSKWSSIEMAFPSICLSVYPSVVTRL